MPDLVETIKRIAVEAFDAAGPLQLVFGEVVEVSPLTVAVGDKLRLSGSALLIPQSMVTRALAVDVSWTSDSGTGLSTQHSHSTRDGSTSTDGFSPAHTHKVTGARSMTLQCGFAKGDKLFLLQMQGGQRYLILDKAVSA